jgi:hypothetical protein
LLIFENAFPAREPHPLWSLLMTPAERPSDETIRLALGRILDSKDFQRSERLRAFLAYVIGKGDRWGRKPAERLFDRYRRLRPQPELRCR